MKIDRNKLKLAMCRACMNSSDAADAAQIPRATFNNAITGKSIRPATMGKIARALNVDVEDLLLKED